MGDALANFVATGKLNFGNLAQSFITDMARIEMRILASQILTSLFGGIPATGYSASDNPMVIAAPNANGGVYSSPSLSAYSGQVVSSPTVFAFARGAGVMGEAGPEAIMPLTRGPNGKLGVQASGDGGGAQVEINITNNGQAVQAQQTGQRMDGKKMIIDMVIEAAANDLATGGKIAKAGQQRFGWQRRGVPVGGA